MDRRRAVGFSMQLFKLKELDERMLKTQTRVKLIDNE